MEENVADALKMAAAVLLFVLALTICMSSFSNARSTAQIILEMRDREYDYSYVESAKTTRRVVGAETVIPTVYRAYAENYKVFFLDKQGNEMALYQKLDTRKQNGIYEPINYIDLEKETIRDDTIKNNFLKGILYGKESLELDEVEFFEKRGIKFFTKTDLYDKIILCKVLPSTCFEEFLGEYYQEDLIDEEDINNGSTIDTDPVPETNKTKKRVITYQIKD